MNYFSRKKWVYLAGTLILSWIALQFIYGAAININNGQKQTAKIVTEVKKIGYLDKNFYLARFNIINKIGGGRELYADFKYDGFDNKTIEEYYEKALTNNGWIKNGENAFSKDNLELRIIVMNSATKIIIKTK